MPIITRVLTKTNEQADGRWRIHEELTDSKGRKWRFNSLRPSVAEATTNMNARDLTEDLREAERAEVLEFALDGNDPETFVLEDLTVVGMRRHLLRYFVRTRMTEGTPEGQAHACMLAGWVADRPVNQIETTLGVTTVKATSIRDRGVNLRDVLCPALTSDNVDVDGIEDAGA
jgi:hypothetical protein